jgi:plastocyanin
VGPLVSGDNLAPGETKYYYYYDYLVPPGEDPLVNTVTADAMDPQGWAVSDQDSWSVDIYHPGIQIEKTGPATAHEGDTITYTYTVTNTGDVQLDDFDLLDSIIGWIEWGNTLAVGETKTYTATYTVPPGVGPLYNFADTFAYDPQGWELYDWAEWTVDILPPV